jgi:diacylglycerol kinase
MKNRLKSFKYALNGLISAFYQSNFRIQLSILFVVLVAGVMTSITQMEWCLIVIVSTVVLTTEAINTSIEEICNFLTREHNPHIGKIKDIAAGAVLISAVGAVVVGLIIFLPRMAS